ncbi:hypothetical protein D5S18_31065 [Nocardia panacis]|uniref:Uncharacterized protein n=1 Tax=Nocardia panacis TaxID=2340916 RepID=A0A3A4JZZ1_9NOCA|nr:hypothetical protein D5S18_31065 [Nocardia panacis]
MGPNDRVVVVGSYANTAESNKPDTEQANTGNRRSVPLERRVVIGGAFPTRRAIGATRRRRRLPATVFDRPAAVESAPRRPETDTPQ